jgi:hypothetical protein
MVERAIYIRLLNDPEVNAVVARQVYPHIAPENVSPPYVVIQRVSGSAIQTFEGCGGMRRAMMQIDIIGSTAREIQNAAEAVRQSLQGFVATVAGISIGSCYLESEMDMSGPPFDGSDLEVFRMVAEYDVMYAEEFPLAV